MSAPTNPFPGMNPWLEQVWNEVHPTVLVHAREQLQERLPADLRAHLEHHLAVETDGGPTKEYRADVAVTGSMRVAEDPPTGVGLAEPVLVEIRASELRHIRITELSGRLVTVVELFSPTNKLRAEQRMDFWLKRQRCIAGGIGFVQIDLLLQGEPVLEPEALAVLRLNHAEYHVATHGPDSARVWRLYPIGLRDALPAVGIPLRPHDQPAPLALQPLVDAAFRAGRYDYLDYRKDPISTLSDEDRAWLDAHLRQQGLR